MSQETKVNFEIVGVNVDRGVAYVKYWADGATVERFAADIGPYELPMTPECATMTDEEFKTYIANYGIVIVTRQKIALDSESVGANTRFESVINLPLDVIITANTA